jgi:hypothetical protein
MWPQHGPGIVAHRARQTKGLPILAIVPKFVQHNRTVARTLTVNAADPVEPLACSAGTRRGSERMSAAVWNDRADENRPRGARLRCR